jgi:hypothetical protein
LPLNQLNETMRQIQVTVTGQVHVSTEGTNVAQAMDLMREARRNRLKVIEGALSVESLLESVILHYFLGDSHDKREAFKALILDSDWCSFAAKRKLITHIINDQNLLEGRDKDAFDKLLRDVMSFRNAFTHGKLSSDATRVWLSYFESAPRKKELTDDYLARVETSLRTAQGKALELAIKIGATKRSEDTNGAA